MHYSNYKQVRMITIYFMLIFILLDLFYYIVSYSCGRSGWCEMTWSELIRYQTQVERMRCVTNVVYLFIFNLFIYICLQM